MSFSDYKEQYKQTLLLAAPVVLSQVGQVVVQLVDNAMVGRLGADPLAAVSFGGSVFFLLFIFAIGVTLGITPLVGEMYSKGSHRISAIYLQNSLLLYTTLGVVLFGILYAATPLLAHMNQPDKVVELALPYYKYLVWSIIPFMIFAAFKQFLEGMGNTKVAMIIILTSNLINVLFNYLLIYGNFGFPNMGPAGAGLATLISRICTPIFIIAYFAKKDSFYRYFSFFQMKNFSFRWVKSLLSVGVPISLQMTMEGGAFALTIIMMGWIGTIELAANQIAISMANFAFMIILGVASATTIMVSHCLGRGDLVALKKTVNASYRIAVVYNLFAATVFIALRNYIPLAFTSDPEVIAVASKLLIFVAIFQVSDGLQIISLGVLRGLRDVKSAMIIAFFSYIVVNIPLAYVCAFIFKIGAPGLWMGFIAGLSIAAVLLNRRWRKQFAQLQSQK